MLKYLLLLVIVAISLCSCAMNNLRVYGPIDTTDKTVTVPAGSRGLLGDLKDTLIKDGWKLTIDRGPAYSEDASDDGKFKVKHYDTFKTRYRLQLSSRQYDICLNASPAIVYDLSFIDNKTGEEVFTLNGNSCENFVIDKFISAVNSKTE